MQDEPFGSLSIYAQYCVMRLAQKKAKVVLDGQGADDSSPGTGLPRELHPGAYPDVSLVDGAW